MANIRIDRRDRTIKKKTKSEKESCPNLKCAEIEELENKHDSFNMHKKVKEVAGMIKENYRTTLMNEDGITIRDSNKGQTMGKQYKRALRR